MPSRIITRTIPLSVQVRHPRFARFGGGGGAAPPPAGPDPPGAPQNLTVVLHGTIIKTTLNWTAPITGSPAVTYNVYRQYDGGAFSLVASGVAGLTYVDTTIVPGTIGYRVAGVDAVPRIGAQTATQSVVFATAPSVPTGLTATIIGGNTTIALDWNAPATGAPVVTYTVYRNINGSAYSPYATGIVPSAYTDPDPPSNRTLGYKVAGVDAYAREGTQTAAQTVVVPQYIKLHGMLYYTYDQGNTSNWSVATMQASSGCRRGYNYTTTWRQFFLDRGLAIQVWDTTHPDVNDYNWYTAPVIEYSLNAAKAFVNEEDPTAVTRWFHLRGVGILHAASACHYFHSGHGLPAAHLAEIERLSKVGTKCGVGLLNFESHRQSLEWSPMLAPLLAVSKQYPLEAATTTCVGPNLNSFGCTVIDKYETLWPDDVLSGSGCGTVFRSQFGGLDSPRVSCPHTPRHGLNMAGIPTAVGSSTNWTSPTSALLDDSSWATTTTLDAILETQVYTSLATAQGSGTVDGIVVYVKGKKTGTDTNNFQVSLSWNGGSSWSAWQTTGNLTSSDQTLAVGSPVDTWGHAWKIDTELRDTTKLKVRVRAVGGVASAPTWHLNYVSVVVYTRLVQYADNTYSKHTFDCDISSNTYIQALVAAAVANFPASSKTMLWDNLLENPFDGAALNGYAAGWTSAVYYGARNAVAASRTGWKGFLQHLKEAFSSQSADFLWCNSGPFVTNYLPIDCRNRWVERFFFNLDGSTQAALATLKSHVDTAKTNDLMLTIHVNPQHGDTAWATSPGPGGGPGVWADIVAYMIAQDAVENFAVTVLRGSHHAFHQTGFHPIAA